MIYHFQAEHFELRPFLVVLYVTDTLREREMYFALSSKIGLEIPVAVNIDFNEESNLLEFSFQEQSIFYRPSCISEGYHLQVVLQ